MKLYLLSSWTDITDFQISVRLKSKDNKAIEAGVTTANDDTNIEKSKN